MNSRQRRKLVKLVIGGRRNDRSDYAWHREGGTLIGWVGGPTDEGWSSSEVTISRDGRRITSAEDGRDCDGRMSSGRACQVVGFRWWRNNPHGPWNRGLVTRLVESCQRDYTAESMGY